MRFRLSAHTLNVAAGRWHHVPHAQCLCEYCAQCKVEDEYHLLFECDAYNPVRLWSSPLFTVCGGLTEVGRVAGAAMRNFMAQHPRQVAAFVHACFVWRAGADRSPPYVPADYLLDTFSSSVSHVTTGSDVDNDVSSSHLMSQ